MKKSVLLLSALLLSFNLFAQVLVSSKDNFLRMSQYMSNGTGQWVTQNPDYDPENPQSAESFGLWFEFLHKKNALKLIHVVHRGDTAHVTAESFWVWHPTKQQIHYHSINIRGTVLEGEVFFPEKNTFVTHTEDHQSNGKITITRDRNIMVSDDVHKTISANFKDGKWVDNQGFTWKRSQDKFDKVIKIY